MAPIAISPIENQNDVELRIKKNISQYKEQAAGPQTYNKQLEEEGSAEIPKAKVYPQTNTLYGTDAAIIVYKLSSNMGFKPKVSTSRIVRACRSRSQCGPEVSGASQCQRRARRYNSYYRYKLVGGSA